MAIVIITAAAVPPEERHGLAAELATLTYEAGGFGGGTVAPDGSPIEVKGTATEVIRNHPDRGWRRTIANPQGTPSPSAEEHVP